MPRARDPNRDKAFEIFKEHNGDIANRKIAELLDCPEKTIGGWKSKDKWNKKLNGVLQTDEQSTPNKNKPKKIVKKEVAEIEEVPLNENGELTEKQWLFCMYYTKYWNATKAYQKAYECSYMVANKNAYLLMVNHGIKAEIERIKTNISSGIMIDAKVVLQKYIDIAFADIGDYISFEKYSVTIKDLKEVDTSLLTEVSNTEDGVKLKLADKMKALDFLTKYTDLLGEKELKQLKVERERIAVRKENGEEEEYEDDGFIEALAGTEVDWDD